MSVGFPLTTVDLALMPDDGHRYELLEAELVVSRAPSLSHQRISETSSQVARKWSPYGTAPYTNHNRRRVFGI